MARDGQPDDCENAVGRLASGTLVRWATLLSTSPWVKDGRAGLYTRSSFATPGSVISDSVGFRE
jgi:hypothetical protein